MASFVGKFAAPGKAAAAPLPHDRHGLPGDRTELALNGTIDARHISELTSAVENDGGAVLGSYRDPFGATPVLIVALPIDRVEPTPYQRDPSEPHVRRLMTVIEKVGRFLDPLVLIRQDEGYWTPNGNHRLQAMRKLGARTIVGLLVADPDVAFKILALNTEKAHNVKEKSLETIRMRGRSPDESRGMR